MSNEQIIFLLRMAAFGWCRQNPDDKNRPFVVEALKLTEGDRLPARIGTIERKPHAV